MNQSRSETAGGGGVSLLRACRPKVRAEYREMINHEDNMFKRPFSNRVEKDPRRLTMTRSSRSFAAVVSDFRLIVLPCALPLLSSFSFSLRRDVKPFVVSRDLGSILPPKMVASSERYDLSSFCRRYEPGWTHSAPPLSPPGNGFPSKRSWCCQRTQASQRARKQVSSKEQQALLQQT